MAPAYDFVPTLAHIHGRQAALKFSRSARWDGITESELSHLAAKAGPPERLIVTIARETVARFREVWGKEAGYLLLHGLVADVVNRQHQFIPLAGLDKQSVRISFYSPPLARRLIRAYVDNRSNLNSLEA